MIKTKPIGKIPKTELYIPKQVLGLYLPPRRIYDKSGVFIGVVQERIK